MNYFKTISLFLIIGLFVMPLYPVWGSGWFGWGQQKEPAEVSKAFAIVDNAVYVIEEELSDRINNKRTDSKIDYAYPNAILNGLQTILAHIESVRNEGQSVDSQTVRKWEHTYSLVSGLLNQISALASFGFDEAVLQEKYNKLLSQLPSSIVGKKPPYNVYVFIESFYPSLAEQQDVSNTNREMAMVRVPKSFSFDHEKVKKMLDATKSKMDTMDAIDRDIAGFNDGISYRTISSLFDNAYAKKLYDAYLQAALQLGEKNKPLQKLNNLYRSWSATSLKTYLGFLSDLDGWKRNVQELLESINAALEKIEARNP